MKHSVYIQKRFNHPIQKVWEHITQKKHVSKWLFNVEEFELRPGGRYHLTKEPSDTWNGHLLGEVLAVEEPNKLVHTFETNDIEGKTTVTWLLEETDEGATILTLTHSGINDLSNRETMSASIDSGWADHLSQLTTMINSQLEN